MNWNCSSFSLEIACKSNQIISLFIIVEETRSSENYDRIKECLVTAPAKARFSKNVNLLSKK